jgi:hypothetical protein
MALTCLVVIACGTDASVTTTTDPVEVDPKALLGAMVGPWRSEPLPLPQPLVTTADQVCRRDPGFPGGVNLVLFDARGDGKLMAYYAGPGATADCSYLTISPTGEVTGSLSGTSNGLEPNVAPGRLQITGGMGSSDEQGAVWQAISGRAGAGIERVVIEVADIGPVVATLRSGWFSAWWPVGEPMRSRDAPGPHIPSKAFVVAAYDAFDRQVDTYISP